MVTEDDISILLSKLSFSLSDLLFWWDDMVVDQVGRDRAQLLAKLSKLSSHRQALTSISNNEIRAEEELPHHRDLRSTEEKRELEDHDLIGRGHVNKENVNQEILHLITTSEKINSKQGISNNPRKFKEKNRRVRNRKRSLDKLEL